MIIFETWSVGRGKLKIFPTARNLLNDKARKQRAKEDNKKQVRRKLDIFPTP